MPTEKSMQLAASAWCRETTCNKIMDVTLATVFAEILDEQDQAVKSAADKIVNPDNTTTA